MRPIQRPQLQIRLLRSPRCVRFLPSTPQTLADRPRLPIEQDINIDPRHRQGGYFARLLHVFIRLLLRRYLNAASKTTLCPLRHHHPFLRTLLLRTIYPRSWRPHLLQSQTTASIRILLRLLHIASINLPLLPLLVPVLQTNQWRHLGTKTPARILSKQKIWLPTMERWILPIFDV